MKSILLDLIDVLGRASPFANAGNLGEALRMMCERDLEEIERSAAADRRDATHRLMQRPQSRRFRRVAARLALVGGR